MFHVSTRVPDTYKHVTECWQHCVFIPLAKRPDVTTRKFEKFKERVVPRQRREEGRTKIR
jgi:hypothetical protein